MIKLPSKVAHNRPKYFFQYCQPAQRQPTSEFLFHKNCSPYNYVFHIIAQVTQNLELSAYAQRTTYLFFGRIENSKNCFQDLLTFRWSQNQNTSPPMVAQVWLFYYCGIQSYIIKSAPWTILWFTILGIFSVEYIKRLCVFMFETCSNNQLLRRVL